LANISGHLSDLVVVGDGVVNGQNDGRSREAKDDASVSCVLLPEEEGNGEHLEDVEGVEDFIDQDREDRNFWDFNLALSEPQFLEIALTL
jgi:hypothetical protein